jgi:hypothetical protein
VASVRFAIGDGVEVPMPSFPVKYEVAVVVAIRFPTVNCVPVATSVVPALSETIIEFGANDVAFVPPPAVDRVPDKVGAKVSAPEVGIMVMPCV